VTSQRSSKPHSLQATMRRRFASRVFTSTSGDSALGVFIRDGWLARARTHAFASTSASSTSSSTLASVAAKDSTPNESPDARRHRPPPTTTFTPPEIDPNDPSRPRRPRPRARVDVADVFKAKTSTSVVSDAETKAADADEEEDRARRRRAFHAARGMDVPEHGGPSGLEPTRYGDWERAGRVSDF